MKAVVVLVSALATFCLLFTSCWPEPETRDTRSSSSEPTLQEQRLSTSSVDPWKSVSEWPVPAGPVGDAQRFLLNAPAYQCTSDGEDLNTHQKNHAEASVVRNGAISALGIITDGKREFVFYRGRYGEEHGDSAATLVELLRQTSLQRLLEQSEEHATPLGVEKVGDVEAEVYALSGRMDNGRLAPPWALGGGHARVWIARDDHRPLKVERKENYSLPLKSGATRLRVDTQTFRYDPGVKVVLPDS